MKKYKVFSTVVLLLLLAIISSLLNKTGITDVLLIAATLMGLILACVKSYETMQHGYFGILLLPIIGATTALFLRDFKTAALFSLLISIETPLLDFVRMRSKPSVGKTIGLSTVKHAPLVRYLDKASLPFMILVIFIGGGVWVASGETVRFVEVIASASMAPLLWAAPVCFLIGMNQLANRGVVLRSAVMFEKLGSAKALFLKKTGILTSSDLRVLAINSLNKHTKDEVIKVAASLAASSSHHAAQAITNFAREKHHSNRAKHVDEIPGMGVAGRMKGIDLMIGRLSFLEQRGVVIPASLPKITETVVYVASDGELIGYITFIESLLPGAKSISKKLYAIGVKSITLVSGSSQSSTASIAKQAAISDAYGEMYPGDIIRLIENSKESPVIFMGNAETDAAILPAADIAITTGEEVSGYVSISDFSIDKLIATLTVAKNALTKTFRIVVVSLCMTLILIVVAASGALTPLQAVCGNLALTFITIILSGFTGLREAS